MPIAPWGDHRAKVDGAEFERVVAELLREAGRDLSDFRLEQQQMVSTHDGQYRIDVTLRFSQLGVQFVVLVECKDHARPVEREDVQVLADKKRAAAAHKAILFFDQRLSERGHRLRAESRHRAGSPSGRSFDLRDAVRAAARRTGDAPTMGEHPGICRTAY